MAVDRARINNLLVPGLRKAAFEMYDAIPSLIETIYNMNTSRRAFEEWTALTTLGPAEEKAEGMGIIYKDPTVLTPKRVSMVTYALGIRCTMEAKQDEQYGNMNKLAMLLGRSHKIRREIEGTMILNGAFSTFNATGHDGKALCAEDHPITGTKFAEGDQIADGMTARPTRSGTTAQNEPTTASDLDYTSLQDLLTLASRQVDEQGDWIAIPMRWLVVSPENQWVAQELLKSSDRPDTANRATNVLPSLQWTMSPYLLDKNAWFLLADKSNHDLQWFNRMPFTTDSEDDFNTGDTLMKGVQRFGNGFHNWRGVLGNPGN